MNFGVFLDVTPYHQLKSDQSKPAKNPKRHESLVTKYTAVLILDQRS